MPRHETIRITQESPAAARGAFPTLLATARFVREAARVPVRAALDRATWRDVAARSFTIPPVSIQDPALRALFGGGPTQAGVAISEQTALTIAAVWDAVQVIAGDVGSLPLLHYKRLAAGGKERMTWSPIYRLLHDEFNPEMTAIVARETMQQHVLLWGNAYAEIERLGTGRPGALWPITPDRVRADRTQRTKALIYEVANTGGRNTVLQPEDMLHIPGLGFDGITGYSVIAKARESLGLTLAAERFGAQFFGKGARSGGVFQHPGKLTPEAHGRIKESLKNLHPHEYAVLEEGMTLERWTIPPDDAQFLVTRQFQVTDVARWFNLPPHKIKDLTRSTNNNIEHQGIEYVIGCLRKWLVRWEQEINRKLIAPLERKQEFVEHLVDALLRGDIQSRYAAYATGRQWGWLSADDVLEKENMNPLPNGQGRLYLIPTNMLPADKAKDMQAPGSQPTAAAPAAEPKDPEEDARVLAAAIESLRPDIARVEEAIRQAVAAGQTDVAEAMETGLRSLRDEVLEHERALLAASEARAAESAQTLRGDLAATADRLAQLAVAQEERHVARDEAEAAERRARASEPVVVAGLSDLVAEIRAGNEAASTHAGILAAHRHNLVDAYRRLLHREGLAARKKAQTPEKLRAWMDDFYPRRQPMTDTVMPAMALHVVLARSVEPAAARAETLIAAHCQRSRVELETLLDAAPADLTAAVEALTGRWEQDRPGQVADELMQEVSAHVGD